MAGTHRNRIFLYALRNHDGKLATLWVSLEAHTAHNAAAVPVHFGTSRMSFSSETVTIVYEACTYTSYLQID